jgi:hypothetical protein
LKKAVFVHSYNVNAKNWHQTVWGNPPAAAGRIPKGIAVFLEENADYLILIGSAIGKEGNSSGEWMRDLLFKKIEELPQFEIYPILTELNLEKLKALLAEKLQLVPGREVYNTAGELRVLAEICKNLVVTKIFLVSSPDHISRIAKLAYTIWKEEGIASYLAANFYCSPSITLYTQEDNITSPELAKVSRVVVIEPRLVKRIENLIIKIFDQGSSLSAIAEIEKVLEKYHL